MLYVSTHAHTAQDIVDRRRVLLQRSEEGLGIAILVGWSAIILPLFLLYCNKFVHCV